MTKRRKFRPVSKSHGKYSNKEMFPFSFRYPNSRNICIAKIVPVLYGSYTIAFKEDYFGSGQYLKEVLYGFCT